VTQSESWPYQEASRILERVGDPRREIILQTGFGPSGFPHIGTFGEVTRTTFIRRALADLGATSVRLLTFSDDMDGLRKVPLNFPSWLTEHLGRPLNEIPDPFGCCPSYSHHMNGKLKEMLDRFGFEYEFKSSAEEYKGGVFNEGLVRILEKVDVVRQIILPTLGEDKRDNWSPFLPICTQCRRLYTTRVTGTHPERATVSYVCDGQVQTVKGCGHSGEVSVKDGNVKVGWKADWALRWLVYGITYEMYGKDLIESSNLSGKIVRALGGNPPLGFFFELFLDETGAKISKSIGKGVTVETWLKYAPVESLALFMFRNPRRAKRLFLGVIPQQVDELLDEMETHYKTPSVDGQRSTYRFLNPTPPASNPFPMGLRYGMLSVLAGAIGTPDPKIVTEYVKRGLGWPEGDDRALGALISQSTEFYRDVLLPSRVSFTPAAPHERDVVARLESYLASPHAPDEIQKWIYDLGKEVGLEPKDVFRILYLVITGQEKGPRLGPFIALLGQERIRELLRHALDKASD